MSRGGFCGIDPGGLLHLADSCDLYAVRVSLAGSCLEALTGGDDAPILTVVNRDLTDIAANLRWRASLIAEAGDVAPFLRTEDGTALITAGEFAATVVFEPGERTEALREWTTMPASAALIEMSPDAVARRFTALSPRLAGRLVLESPGIIGGLDGAPPQLRYQANRILINRQIRQLEEATGGGPSGWERPGVDPVVSFLCTRFAAATVAMRKRAVDELRRWLDEDRQILLFDPSGDGRVAEIFGDLETAHNVAVVIPGARNEIGTFSDGGGGFRATARNLERKARLDAGGEGIATIAWLGYDPPDGADVMSRDAASDGSTRLVRFVAGLDPDDSRHVTVIGHSYGSVVAGMAAATGLDVDELVFVGSPGTTLDAASAAVIRPGGRVWAATSSWDPIGAGISPEELPPFWVPPGLAPAWFLFDLEYGGAEKLWHGTNPVSDGFGAEVFITDGAAGHSAYFNEETDSLANLARIVTGRGEDVVRG